MIQAGWDVDKQVIVIESGSDDIRFWRLMYKGSLLALLCVTAGDKPMQQVWEQALAHNGKIHAPMFIYYSEGTILLDTEFTNLSTHTIRQLNAFPSPEELEAMLPHKEAPKEEQKEKTGKKPLLLIVPLALIGLLAAIIAFIISLLKRTRGDSSGESEPRVLVSPAYADFSSFDNSSSFSNSGNIGNSGNTTIINNTRVEAPQNSTITASLNDLAERQIPNVDIHAQGSYTQGVSAQGSYEQGVYAQGSYAQSAQSFEDYDIVVVPSDAPHDNPSNTSNGITSNDSPASSPDSPLQQFIEQFPKENVICPSGAGAQGTVTFNTWIQQVVEIVNASSQGSEEGRRTPQMPMAETNIMVNYHNHELTSITNWNELVICIAQIAPIIYVQNKFNPIHIETMAEKDSIRAQIEMAEELKRYLHGFQERLGAAAENYKKKCDDLYDAGMLREKIEFFQGNNLAETINRLASVVETINDRDIPFIEKYIQQLEDMLQNNS